MGYGKTIELYLVDGTYDGIVTAELSNWSGKAIKISRSEIAKCNRDEIQSTGVYFLFCKEEDGQDSVYIGEAENIKNRLLNHLTDYNADKEKYYWNIALCFCGRDLNKALIRYLEKRLVEITKEVGRYKVLTKNTYRNTVMKESQISAMEEFIANIQIVINAMGYKILEPIADKTTKKEYLYIKNKRNSDAKGFISNEGFVVVKGSKISDDVTLSFKEDNYCKLREKLISQKIIEDLFFVKDYVFNSPSAASSVIIGNSTNGKLEWKNESGKTLKDL